MSDESRKRSADQMTAPGASGPAKKKAGPKKKLEQEALSRWRKEIVPAVSAGWGAVKSILDSVIAAINDPDCLESDFPHLPFTLYSELTDILPDGDLRSLVEYMNSPPVTSLCRDDRRIPLPFLEGILAATKTLGARVQLCNAEVSGEAQLLQSRLGCMRHDVTMLNKGLIRTNDTLDGIAAVPPVATPPLAQLYDSLRTNYKNAVPKENQLAADVKDLQGFAHKLASLTDADALTVFTVEMETLTKRLLAALDALSSECPSVKEAAAGVEPSGYRRLRPTAGEWEPVAMQNETRRLQCYLMLSAVLGSIMYKCLDEAAVDGTAKAKAARLEENARVMFNGVKEVGRSMERTLTNGKPLAENMRSEFWREHCWYSWKKAGCSPRVLEGAAAAALDLENRSSKGPKARASQIAPREKLNTVALPQRARAALAPGDGGFPVGDAPSKKQAPAAASEEWVDWLAAAARADVAALPAAGSSAWAADGVARAKPPAFPDFREAALDTETGVWLAARLLPYHDLEAALEDGEGSSFWYTDADLFAKVLRGGD